MSDPHDARGRSSEGASLFGPRGAPAIALFVVAVVTIAKTLEAFAAIIRVYLAVHYDWRLEVGLVTGQVIFQWLWMARRSWPERLSYAWILIAVSSGGAVLLWPLLAVASRVTPLQAVGWFFAVVAVMFVGHAWLVVRARLPAWLCATWVLYRLGLLAGLVRWSLFTGA
jgi:hypothetical protein